jgi:hypothetical protein
LRRQRPLQVARDMINPYAREKRASPDQSEIRVFCCACKLLRSHGPNPDAAK